VHISPREKATAMQAHHNQKHACDISRKQPSALLGCHSTLSLPRAGTVYIRTIKSRRDKVTNKTGWHIHELVEQDVQTLSNVNYKLLSHDLLLPLVGRELSDQISVTAK